MEIKTETAGLSPGLTKAQRRYLAKAGQSLKPIVTVGRNGLTPEVAKALDEALEHHELVKVKFFDYKENRGEMAQDVATRLGALVVEIRGFKAVLYRQSSIPEKQQYSLPKN